MNFFSKALNFVTAKSQNELFDYLKYIVYDTTDKKVLEKQELALDYLFNGLAFLEKKKFNKAIGFIQSALDIYQSAKDDLRQAFGFFFMGVVYKEKEDYSEARNFFIQAESIFKQKNNKMQHACENKLKEMEP